MAGSLGRPRREERTHLGLICVNGEEKGRQTSSPGRLVTSVASVKDEKEACFKLCKLQPRVRHSRAF